MNAAALALALVAARAGAAPPPARLAQTDSVPAPITAPAPVTAPAPTQPAAAPAPVAAPVVVVPAPSQPPAAAPALPPGPSSSPAPAPPSQALIDKLGQGDRAFLSGDYRNALFAYQDAVYMAPTSAAARVKLGRAYLALHYPAQALAQAEMVLASDPANEDARRLAQDAKNPPPPQPVVAKAQAAPAPIVKESAAPRQARVYRFVPEPDAASTGSRAAEPPPAADPRPGPEARATASAFPRTQDAPATEQPRPPVESWGPPAGTAGPVAPPAAPTAGQRYRTAIALLARRDYRGAIVELSEAIRTDPRLAVAYSARGSAEFGLQRYREASDDYGAAMSLDPGLAMPLYGLAECYRALGDSAGAADMYRRYAESSAPDVRDDLRSIAARRSQELR